MISIWIFSFLCNSFLMLLGIYMQDPPQFKQRIQGFLISSGIYALDAYIYVREGIQNNIYKPYLKEILFPKYKYLVYNYNKNAVEHTNTFRDIDGLQHFLVTYDGDVPYYQYVNPETSVDSDDEPAEHFNPFMQITVQNNEETIDITDSLKHFCVEGNELDCDFFHIFINDTFTTELFSDYKINIMDKEFNMLEVDATQTIHIGSREYDVE